MIDFVMAPQGTPLAPVEGAHGLLSRLFRRPPGPLAAEQPTPSPSWDALLRRCREVTRADCVFAVDAEGLVVAREGTYGRAEVERVAAHLSKAFDLLDGLTEIGSETESICTRYAEERWLTAVRVRPDDGRVVTLGVIGPYTMITRDRQRLRNTFLQLFAPPAAVAAA